MFLVNDSRIDAWVRQVGQTSGTTNAFDGNWHLAVLRWRSSDGRAELFLDGDLLLAFTAASGNSIVQGGAVVVGQEQDALGGGYDPTQAFVGSIDDVRTYQRWLTNDELVQLASGNGETDVGLLLSWDFDNGSATDLSGAGNSGTINNATVIADLPETDRLRSLCLAMSVGAGASECGDLRLAHALPAITTLNTPRAPMLVYNSNHAHPYPAVAFDAHLPSLATTPDSVRATVMVDSVSGPTRTWSTSDWIQGQTRRMAVAWDGASLADGVHNYTVELRAFIGGVDTTSTLSGQFTIVDRSDSPFGAGWWLAGLERLDVGNMVWTGGDGSVRKYEPAGTGKWAARSLVRPDTIKLVSGKYVRYLPDSVKVRFDAQGRHVETENRLGYKTIFGYDGSGRLDTITLPTAGATSPTYTFNYTSGVLSSVTAPPMGSTSRITQISTTSGRVTAIQDPDGESVSFGYTGGLTNQITSRTDKRGTTVAFNYDAAQKVQSSTVDMPSPQSDIVMTYRSAESVGVNGPVGGAAMAAMVDGPRNVADSTRFWVNALGQPTMIVNGLNDTTQIFYEDGNLPALATKIRHPNGWLQTSTYDGRGRVTSTTDHSTSPVATTTYTWHSTWDAVTKIMPPEGDSTVFGIDSNNGNRLWAQDARGDSTRTDFQYDAGDPALLTRIIGPANDTTTIDHDALGNVAEVTSPLGFVAEYHKDGLGRDTLVVAPIASGKASKQRVVYDLMDRIDTTMTIGPSMSYGSTTAPAETLTVVNAYDDGGLPTEVRRRSDPDINSIGWDLSLFTYDALGRTLVERHNGRQDSTVYDPAGNPIKLITDRGDSIELQYDALNRLIERTVPPASYGPGDVAPEINTDYHRCSGAPCPWEFPLYPNSGSSYVIGSDVSTYEYNDMGQMTRAENNAATVRRSYFTNGLLRADTIGFKNGSPVSYGLEFTYDLNGRRKTMKHPGNLSLGSGIQTYDYTTFGAMWKTTSVLGHVYEYGYDSAGRVTTFGLPIGSEVYAYDRGGRRTQRTVTVNSTVRYRDGFTYDRRGRILTVSPVGSPAEDWTANMAYSGIGALVFSEFESPNAPYLREEFQTDALGNRKWSSTYTPTMPCGDGQETSLTYVSGRLFELSGSEPWPTCLPPNFDMFQDTTVQRQDASGNVERVGREEWFAPEGSQWAYREGSWNYYSADQKLAARQVYRDTVEIINASFHPVRDRWGVWEEYEYDPLGRRIRKVVDRGNELCSRTSCISSTARYIWDGDQLLYETRSGGGGQDQNGTVGYTHGLGLDAPLDVMRQNYSYTSDRAVIPHTNWRGSFTSGTFADNGQAFDCVVLGCDVAWPAGNQSAFLYDGKNGLPDWMGSLWDSQRDESGLMYMRNRYYDPATGRFTQQDPIGLAGGLNLYGFAVGDPVNFDDPYGLCPPIHECPGFFTAVFGAAGFLIGGAGGGGGGFALAALTGGLGAPAVPVFSVSGAVGGATAGARLGLMLDGLVLALKGESAEIGRAIEHVLGKEANTAENRRDVGEYCEECKQRGDRGSKNEKGDFTFKELIEKVKEFFNINE